jgi:hypothetical protein
MFRLLRELNIIAQLCLIILSYSKAQEFDHLLFSPDTQLIVDVYGRCLAERAGDLEFRNCPLHGRLNLYAYWHMAHAHTSEEGLDYFTISRIKDQACLTADGGKVIAASCHQGDSQLWRKVARGR